MLQGWEFYSRIPTLILKTGKPSWSQSCLHGYPCVFSLKKIIFYADSGNFPSDDPLHSQSGLIPASGWSSMIAYFKCLPHCKTVENSCLRRAVETLRLTSVLLQSQGKHSYKLRWLCLINSTIQENFPCVFISWTNQNVLLQIRLCSLVRKCNSHFCRRELRKIQVKKFTQFIVSK